MLNIIGIGTGIIMVVACGFAWWLENAPEKKKKKEEGVADGIEHEAGKK